MGKSSDLNISHFTQGKFNPGVAGILIHWISIKCLRLAVYLSMDGYDWSDTQGPVHFSMQALLKVLENAESGKPFTVVFKQVSEEPLHELKELAKRDDCLTNPQILKRGQQLIGELMDDVKSDGDSPKKEKVKTRKDNDGYL